MMLISEENEDNWAFSYTVKLQFFFF